MSIQENADLKQLNTFHVAAQARYFAEVNNIEELQQALSFSQQKQLPLLLIGQGSNVLFADDYCGLVIKLNLTGISLLDEDETHFTVRAACGENWHDFVIYCLSKGYYGLENLSLIPGCVGAAPVQNIGAYGVELSDFLVELEAIEITSGETVTYSKQDCKLAYRHSIFKAELKDSFVITSVTFRLFKNAKLNLSYPVLAEKVKEESADNITPQLIGECVCQIRRSKLPDPEVLGNAGSFFRNPVVTAEQVSVLQVSYPDMVVYPSDDQYKLAAAWLIEQAGWKGYREGDAGVHADHALVLVNHGEARGKDIVRLAQRIQQSVQEKFGVNLEPEVRIVDGRT